MKRSMWLMWALVLAAGLAVFVATRKGVRQSEGFLQTSGVVHGDAFSIVARHGGDVVELLAREGQDIVKGQLVAKLEDGVSRARAEQARQMVAALDARIRSERAGLALLQAKAPLMIQAARMAEEQAQAVLAEAEAVAAEWNEQLEAAKQVEEEDDAARERRERLEEVVAAAEQDVEAARAALERTRIDSQLAQLSEDEMVSRIADIDAIEAERAQVSAVEESARAALDETTVLAPRPGLVVASTAPVGELVAAGGVLFEVLDPSSLHVLVEVPQSLAAQLQHGQEARIILAPSPGEPIEASVSAIGQAMGGFISMKITPLQTSSRLSLGTLTKVIIRLSGDAAWPSVR